MSKITPNLWFDDQAEEAALFYTSIFKDASIQRITRYGKAGFEFHGKPEGSVMTVEFQVESQNFVALNGGPHFTFNEAVSLEIRCDTQEEVDYYWEKLSEGGDPGAQQCGWLKDKYGLSWQIVPTELIELLHDPDGGKVEKMLTAMYSMQKLDIKVLKRAFDS
jgi:predicted 3-demethylubiquinone-9 3-methyltransferase (glyoxalase superfamily)